MKSLISTIKKKYDTLKKPRVLPLLIVVLLFPFSLQAEDSQEGNNASPTLYEVLRDAINDKTALDEEINPPKVNAALNDKKIENGNSETKAESEKTEEKPKQKDLIIKFVKVPEDQRPGVKINLKKNYKKTNLSEQPEDTYQRSVVKYINSELSEQELMAYVNDTCSQYPPNKRKNYNIYLFDQTTGKAIGNHNCGKL